VEGIRGVIHNIEGCKEIIVTAFLGNLNN